MGETGYEDLDRLYNDQNQALDNAQKMNNEIIDKQTQQQVDAMNRQKEEYQREAEKESRGLYTDYVKQSGAYGVEAERRAENGLANSGYAESSQVRMYNQYQENVTEVMNTLTRSKADVDFQINQAYQSADIQKAQQQAQLYMQKMQLALQMYEYKQSRDQFEWQKNTWQQQFDYQKQRDAVSDSQWERQYQLSLQSSRR